MKKIFLLLLIFAIVPSMIFAQGMRERRGPREKIEQLEKVKLIDALNMDEQTTLKFFARRNEFRNRMDALNDSLDTLVDILESEFSGKNSTIYKELINNYLDIEKKIATEHTRFISSLYDILSVEQVAKLVVFEKRFREEIRHILFKGRPGPPAGSEMR